MTWSTLATCRGKSCLAEVRSAWLLVPARVPDVAAAVFPPAVLGMVAAERLLLAEAHGLDLVLLAAKHEQRLFQAVGAALAERDLVLAATTLVGIALDQYL